MIFKKKKIWQVHKGRPKDERDIVIGFDFGTSCVKVILRDFQRKEAFAVPFDGLASKFNRYLLPTRIYVSSDEKIDLSCGEKEIDGIKIDLIQNTSKELLKTQHADEPITPLDLATAYIGLVLIEVRNWFKKEKFKEYRNVHINWQLNIGMPSRSYDDERLCTIMKRVTVAGWNLSLMDKKQHLISDVKRAIEIGDLQIGKSKHHPKTEQLHPDYVNAIPEIIAEVIGYFRSPMRENGMYLIVDVGARTLDVSTFIVHETEDEDLFSILTSEVKILGAYVLHQRRTEACKKIIGIKPSKMISICDGISPLPNVKTYLPKKYHQKLTTISQVDKNYHDECSRLIRRVIKITKDCRNPLSKEWNDGFPVFLCGGGSALNIFKSIFSEIENKLINSAYRLSFSKKELPLPREIQNDEIRFNRMAVAYGLSFPKYDIGDIRPPDKIENMVSDVNIVEIDKFYIDKDMV